MDTRCLNVDAGHMGTLEQMIAGKLCLMNSNCSLISKVRLILRDIKSYSWLCLEQRSYSTYRDEE